MTKIKCDLSGLPLLGIHFMGRVTDVITPARTADSQAVSLDMGGWEQADRINPQIQGTI